ncbi:DUF502 domain-containing protein [Opitutales bacterium]|nr:DUF502 domain-containing protein [Opitutales bacterium]
MTTKNVKSNTLAKRFRNAFLTGLLIFLPLGTTIFVLDFLLDMFKGPVTRLANELGLSTEQFFFGLETLLAVVGLLSGILALTILGFLSNYVLGKFFISSTEKVLDKVPFLSTVYRSVKQIVETFGKDNRAVFREVVLVEYPRKECWVLGFVTADGTRETESVVNRKLINVFVPTTPNPTSGFLLLVPVEDVLPIDVSVGDGMKMLISGGAVTPPKKKGKGRGRGRRKPRSAEKKSEVVSKESTGRPRRRSPRKPKAEET